MHLRDSCIHTLRERDFLFAGSLYKWLQNLKLSRAEAQNLEFSLYLQCGSYGVGSEVEWLWLELLYI